MLIDVNRNPTLPCDAYYTMKTRGFKKFSVSLSDKYKAASVDE